MLTNLKVEYKSCPLGMDEPMPRFSFETGHAQQHAYRISVQNEKKDVVWDSGCIQGCATSQIEYGGSPLQPFTRYIWNAWSYDGAGNAQTSSSWFETGFLGTQWKTPWIRGFPQHLSSYIQVFRTIFDLESVRSARLCITAAGVFEASINGTVVDEDLFPPGFTQYDKQIQYRVYDVTTLLRSGKNSLEIQLANGWFTGRIATLWHANAPTWGEYTMLRGQLRVTDGNHAINVIPLTPDNTSCCQLFDTADIYDGTYVDRQNSKKLAQPTNWEPATEVDVSTLKFTPNIVWSRSEPVVHVMDIAPRNIIRRSNGAYVVDFGQNLVGREEIILRNAPRGTWITIRHGEILRDDGSLYCLNLRSAKAQTIYISGGDSVEIFEPKFTFYGFRYLEVTGWPGELTDQDIKARVIHTRLAQTGDFSCSEPLLNQLNSNILWGQRGNFVDIPTDCPQRDERLGWTADTQVFMDEATWNMDAPAFYTKWLEDLFAMQSTTGGFPEVAPLATAFVNHYTYRGATGWADAGVIVPFLMLEKYGDARLVKKYLPAMEKWLDWQIQESKGTYILDVAYYGDWLYIGIEDKEASPNFTPHDYLSSAYLAGMLAMVAKMYRLIGNEKAALHRMEQYQQARKSFQKHFLDADGIPIFTSQTALLMALKWELFEEKSLKAAAKALIENIRDINHIHLTTGFLGTPLLLDVLTSLGEVDLAYDLLLQSSYPGWLYPVTQGATTVWERWNSNAEEFLDAPSMNSFNHYAYGAVGAWFYRTICGIQPLSDSEDCLGFARFRLAPQFGKRLMSAKASYHSIHGMIISEWTRQPDHTILWNYRIPPNTLAQVATPDGQCIIQSSGDYNRVIQLNMNP